WLDIPANPEGSPGRAAGARKRAHRCKNSHTGMTQKRTESDQEGNGRSRIRQGAQAPALASGQQRPAQVIGAVEDPGRGQEVAAAERADVVDERLVDQAFLHRFELPLYVLLETGEDEPDVEVADLVDAAVVVVRAA